MATRATADQWANRVSAWKRSGRTAEEFANEHDLSAKSLRWWSWKLGQRERPQDRGDVARLIPLRITSTESAPVPRPADDTLEVRIGERVSIRVGRDFDEATLRRVLAIAREVG